MLKIINKTNQDYFAGALMLMVGLGAAALASSYSIGTLTAMGPGFFPAVIGALMSLVGIAIIVTTKASTPKSDEQQLPPEWFAWGCILAAIAAFAILGKYGGLVPATFAVTFISALADRENNWKRALLLAVFMVALAVVVFSQVLQLQLSLFTWG